MKKLVFFIALLIVFASIFTVKACRDQVEGANSGVTNSELEVLYESTPDENFGFSAVGHYTITNYDGSKAIVVPAGQERVFVSTVSGQEDLFYKTYYDGNGIEASSLGKTVKVAHADKPFFELSETADSPIKFSMIENTIGKNSFLFIHGHYDFHGKIGGLFVNGELVSQKIVIGDDVPFLPLSVKKVGKKIIILFTSANRAELYALYNEKTGQLTLPIDYESIENDWTTASKKLKDN